MKKRFYVFSMLAAGMLFAGCSDDLEGGQDGPNVVEGVTGYARLALNLPTDGATTRADNDQFADGLLEEYTVNDGIIAFFTGRKTGTDEEATFVKAYSLNDLSNWTPVGNQITTKKVVISEAPLPATGYQIYALVFLNPNGIVTSTDGGLSIKGGTAITTSSKLSDVRTFLTGQDVNAYTKKGDDASFFMSNAPLASTAAGESPAIKVQTLVPVHVYPTETEAEGNRPNEIYVERAVAKVTLSGFEYDDNGETYTKTVSDDSNIYDGDVVKLEGWTLNMTNKSTAVVRNVTPAADTWSGYQKNSSSYFFGNMSANLLGSGQYRIYWAVDYNYDSDDSNSDGFNVYDKNTASIPWNEDAERAKEETNASHPSYCLENTMDAQLAQSDPAPITYVLLKTTYNFGAGDAGTSFFVVQNAPTKGTMTESDFVTYVNTQMNYSNGDAVSVAEAAKGGTYDTAEEIETLFNVDNTKAAAILAKIGTIKFYENGTTYYYASYIKHFGGTYTLDPRDPNVATPDKTDAKCLGYYGVVRNNWYDLNITRISGPGEPEITPPADNYGYINASINILSWAKRQQDVDL